MLVPSRRPAWWELPSLRSAQAPRPPTHTLLFVELRQAEHFLAVVDCGSLTRAASHLYISQPSLSQSIRTFEADLGVPLFDRVGRRLVLSESGRLVAPAARALLTDAAAARAAVHDVAELRSGELTIAVHSDLMVDPFAVIAGEFRRRHPGIVLNLVDPGSIEAMERMVQSGRCEAGIGTTVPTGSILESIPLGRQELSLVAARSVSLPAGDPVLLRDLGGVPLVLPPPSTSSRVLVESAFASVNEKPWAAVECAPREAIWSLVLEGAGASFFSPTLAEAALAQGAQVRATRPEVSRRAFLVFRGGPSSPALASLMSIPTAGG